MDSTKDKKLVVKVKSHNFGARKSQFVSVKRKSLAIDDAMKSLDLATENMKKSKLSFVGNASNGAKASFNRIKGNMFIDSRTSPPKIVLNNANTSLVSTNLSHYELMRNLSDSNCHSGEAFSATTCNVSSSNSEIISKKEHLEKYFRSAEKWNRELKIVNVNNSFH